MKTISEMNTTELKEYIRTMTTKANETISSINKQTKPTNAVKTELTLLRNKGIIGKSGRAILDFRGKTKQGLIQQARELEYFTQWKGTETQSVRDKTNYAKYKSFKKNNPEFSNYTYQEWRDLVETFGTMDSFIESFGYENLKQLHLESTNKNNNVNFVDIMKQTMKETKGSGASQKEIIDILRSKIFK